VTSYPNFAGKHAEEAIFTPADFAAAGEGDAGPDRRPGDWAAAGWRHVPGRHLVDDRRPVPGNRR
jgi:hypothetical protein